MVHEGGVRGGFAPPGFGLSFLLVHPLLRRVAGAPVLATNIFECRTIVLPQAAGAITTRKTEFQFSRCHLSQMS